MKFFEIDEEYLKKGGLITRDKKSGLAFGVVNGCLVAFNNGIKKEPEEVFKGYVSDLLANDWEYYDTKKPLWKPEEDEKYYFIDSQITIDFDYYCETCSYDRDRVAIGNAFQTQEDAEKMINKLKIINKLKELANKDFNDSENTKYVLYYSTTYNSVSYQQHTCVKELPFNIYFATIDDCENAIKEIGEENLKKYYFEVMKDEKKK